MTEFQKTVINVRDLRFTALAAGPEEGELILFLHGFPEFADAWCELMRPVADAGFYTVAVDQRGYSAGARPIEVRDYGIEHLTADIQGFVDALGRQRFHLVGHDWGAFLAWVFAAKHPDRVQSLSALSTPHPDAFLNAIKTDEDQKQRSRYISFFRMPDGAAESFFQADNYQRLRAVYQGKLPDSAVNENICRFAEPGALTSALNWYRALNLEARIGEIAVPTLYIWSTDDIALGETAAIQTAGYVTGSYRFEKLEWTSHWLLEEATDRISALLLEQISSNPVRPAK
jgi:pimeloyl-ACP methyl ester carboxylesterase